MNSVEVRSTSRRLRGQSVASDRKADLLGETSATHHRRQLHGSVWETHRQGERYDLQDGLNALLAHLRLDGYSPARCAITPSS